MWNKNEFSVEFEVRKGYIDRSVKRIETLAPEQDSNEIYEQLEDIAGHIEKLSYYLRKALIAYHLQLQYEGLKPEYSYLDNPPDVRIEKEDNILNLVFDGIMPIEPNGGAFYLNGKLEDAILGYRQREKLTMPLFTEKCGLIFYHHYNMKDVGVRQIRDFDNLEKRTITNVLARHFMVDDNPLAMASADILVQDNHTHTQVKICSVTDFRRLLSEVDS